MSITNGYVDLELQKSWLNITDEIDDLTLELSIETASRWIDNYCHRQFYADTNASTKRYRASNRSLIFTHDISSTSGLIVKTDDNDDGTFETTWSASDYQLEPDGAPYKSVRALNGYFPIYSTGRYGVQITAKWGFPSVPTEIEQATLILASRIFKRKGSPEGVVGFGEFGAVRITPQDRDVLALINPYRKMVVT